MAQAITDSQLSSLKNQVVRLKKRLLAPTFAETFTYEDYYELFVPRDHVERYKWMLGNVHRPWGPREFSIGWAMNHNLEVYFFSPPYPFIPREVEVQDTARRELLDRVTQWVMQRAQVMEDFGRAMCVLDLLAECCSTPAQVRFYFPQIMPLAKAAGMEVFVKNASRGTPKEIPPIPPDLRVAIRKAAGTCAAAQLLEDPDGEPQWRGAMSFTIREFKVREGTVAFTAT